MNSKKIVTAITLFILLFSYLHLSQETNAQETSVRIVVTSDWHHGASAHITEMRTTIATKNPDFVFDLGDLVEDGDYASQWAEYAQTVDYFKNTVGCRYFAIPGDHDVPGKSEAWNSITYFMDSSGQTAMNFLVKIGNNVFIFISGCPRYNYAWDTYYGWKASTSRIDHQQVWTDPVMQWLDKQLSKYASTCNIFILSHESPVNSSFDSWGWYAEGKHRVTGLWGDILMKKTEQLYQIINKYPNTRIVFFHGHQHHDSSEFYDDTWDTGKSTYNVAGGSVVFGSNPNSPQVPSNLVVAYVGNGWPEHGTGVASFRYFDLVEGRKNITLYSWDAQNNIQLGITVNGSSTPVSSVTIPLTYTIQDLSNVYFQ